MATVFGKKRKKKKVCLNSIKMEKGLLVSEVVEKHLEYMYYEPWKKVLFK